MQNKEEIALLTAKMLEERRPGFNISAFCFEEQLKFLQDPHRFKTAVCSRRAGKTIACAADLLRTALAKPKAVCLYITLSRSNAQRIIWPEITDINRRFMLGGSLDNTALSMKFPNGSVIYCSGAKDKTEIEKFRGLPITLCYVDECQSFKPYIENLIDEVISKALFDNNGTLCLIGTPGPVPSGYFHACAHSPNWAHHAWTMFNNPFIPKKSGKTVQALIQEELDRKGVTADNPTIQRECYGSWCIDADALVFKYNPAINDYASIPEVPGKWEYIIGVDIGFDDADAIAVIGWHEKVKESYLIEERIERKQGITDLASQVGDLIKRYSPLKVVMDTGGLGKKIAEELQMRYGLPIEPAEKSRKFEFIELLNDAMRTKRFHAKRSSQFAQDCMLLEWDKDSTQPKISENFHSDICDAALYAFRESLHWLYEPEPIKPKAGSQDWLAMQEADMEKHAIEQWEKKKQDDIWGDLDFNQLI